MIDLEIGGQVFREVAQSYDELSLGKYLKIEDIRDQYAKVEDPIEKMFGTYEVWAIIIGCSPDILARIKMTDFDQFASLFAWMSDSPSMEVKKTHVIDGTTYIVRDDYRDFTNAEMISVQTIIGNNQKIDSKLFSEILAIILRPSRGSSTSEQIDLDSYSSIQKRAELFKEKLTVSDVWGLIMDFYAGGQKSSQTTPTSAPSFRLLEKTPASEKGLKRKSKIKLN